MNACNNYETFQTNPEQDNEGAFIMFYMQKADFNQHD